MWRKICDKLVNLERLEEQFVEYYGEERRQNIHNKLQHTTFGFVITDLVGFNVLTNSFFVNKIFEGTNFQSSALTCSRLIKLFENDIDWLQYANSDIDRLQYNHDDVLQLSDNNEIVQGPKYEEFMSKLMRAKEVIEENTDNQLATYKQSKEQFKDLLLEAEQNLETGNLDNIVKNEKCFKELITAHSSEEWKKSDMQDVYLMQFNNAFGTNFNSFAELQNDTNFYQIAKTVDKVGEDYRQTISEFKPLEGPMYIIGDNVDDKQIDNLHKSAKKDLDSQTAGLEWTYSEKMFGTNNEELKYNVLIQLNFQTAYSCIIHELTHAMQTHHLLNKTVVGELSGFHITDASCYFNEVITDFLAVEMTKQVTDGKELPIHKYMDSSYSCAFGIMEDFLIGNEELLKDCQFTNNPPKMLAQNIGFKNYKKLVFLTKNFLSCHPSEYVNHIANETGKKYYDAKDLIADMDMLRDKYKDNKQISKFLKTTESLHSLSYELGQIQKNDLER